MKFLLGLFLLCVPAYSKIYFQEGFEDSEKWESQWVQSAHDGKEFGKFILTAGEFYGDAELDKGLKTTQDARFYGLSSKFESFTNDEKPIVIQFTVKHEQKIDCGGGYLKLFDCSLDQKEMHGESPYLIMFGPDICGPGVKKVHVIFNYKGKNLLIKKEISCKDDVYSNLYTLIVKPDNTYEVLINNEKQESGSLEEDWDFLEPKMIKDPEAKKPEDWEDRSTIPDPDDKKPEDWDKPEHIPDPDAVKPEDWDDEMDGEWEPPMIDNPEYKGEWKPKEIDNPNFKGAWIHPEVDNPAYAPDDKLYLQKDVCIVGLDLWQVKSGTIFDNFLITDDVEEAKEIAVKTWGATKDGMKEMKNKLDEEARKQAEAETANEDKPEDNEDLDDEEEEESEHDEL